MHPDNLAIQAELNQLNAAAQQYLKDADAPLGQDARFDLSAKAARLAQSIRGPGATAWGQMENVRRKIARSCDQVLAGLMDLCRWQTWARCAHCSRLVSSE